MIIGIVGFMNSGKGTVSDMLVSDFGYRKMAFADPLKDACSVLFGWDRKLLEGDTKESRLWREKTDQYWSAILGRTNFSPRTALQLLGTEAGRKVFGENIWIASTMQRIAFQSSSQFVISDVRFANEVTAIRAAGGFVVRVKRGEEPEYFQDALLENQSHYMMWDNYDGLMAKKWPNVHASEWDWIGSPQDYLILNDGSLADLQSSVRVMIDTLEQVKKEKLDHESKQRNTLSA